MKKSDIYEIAVKILGLYMFVTIVHLLQEVFNSVVFMNQADEYPDTYRDNFQIKLLLISTINFLITFIIALLFTFKSKAVVRLICKPSDFEETSKLFASKNTIYEISLTIMGLLLFVWTIPELIYGIRTYIQLIPNDTQDSSYIIASAIKLFVGFCIIIYANSIAKYLAKDNNKSVSSNQD